MNKEDSKWERRTFTSFVADVDLTAQSGMPKFPPIRLEVHNDEITTQDIVIRGPDAVNVTVEIPADSVRVVHGQTNAIESTGTQTIASVTAYWFVEGRVLRNT